MVRAPAKTCPNLSRLNDEAGPEHVLAFLGSKEFQRFDWIKNYAPPDAEACADGVMTDILAKEKGDRLKPLETEAARIVIMATVRGEYALAGIVPTKLMEDAYRDLQRQRDALGRSLWCYLNERAVFDAAENSLHLRHYRRYDKHYQTFLVYEDAPGPARGALDTMLEDLGKRLDRGEGYSIDRYDIPAEGDEPAAEMYLLYHPNPPSSVPEIDEHGQRTRLYYLPAGEAMVVYTPATGRVHVRAQNRSLRHEIAKSFTEHVLEQPLSHQPVEFQAYDISRFFESFELDPPELDSAMILSAQVIRAEVSIGNLANRLALATTITGDITAVIGTEPGLQRAFRNAIAIRFIEVAVRYRWAGEETERVLDFTMTDGNTCSLMSLEDPDERILGHQLLRAWGILQDGRAPDEQESRALLPTLLQLWNTGVEKVAGAWFTSRGVDPGQLINLGFLVPAGWADEDLIDEGDDFGAVDAEPIAGRSPDTNADIVDLDIGEATKVPAPAASIYRLYRVRPEWVRQNLLETLNGDLGTGNFEEISSDLIHLGHLEVDGRPVPVYLARQLDNERTRATVDSQLRARNGQGVGLVLQAGAAFGYCLAANVLTKLADHVSGEPPADLTLDRDGLIDTYRRNRSLAHGGKSVSLQRAGEASGTLFVPGNGSIDISGSNRVAIVERLVNAHNSGAGPMKSSDMLKDIATDQSLANVMGKALWSKLQGGFLHSPRKGLWQIAS